MRTTPSPLSHPGLNPNSTLTAVFAVPAIYLGVRFKVDLEMALNYKAFCFFENEKKALKVGI